MIRRFFNWIASPITEEISCIKCGGWGCRHCKWTGRMLETDIGLLLVKGLPCAALFWLILWAIWTMLPS